MTNQRPIRGHPVPEHGQGVGYDDPLAGDVVDSLGLCPLLHDAELGAADGSVGVIEHLHHAISAAHKQLISNEKKE